MFNLKNGDYKITMPSIFYNLPNNKDQECTFTISKSGYLDDIKESKIVLIGGSTAFGTGSTGNEKNISGLLRKKYNLDVINLSVPGYNIEQEILTLLKYIDKIRPNKVIFFNGANNLALGLPFDYNDLPIDKSSISFYGESKYAYTVNQHFSVEKNYLNIIKEITKQILSKSSILRLSYKFFKSFFESKYKSDINIKPNKNSMDNLAKEATENYIRWLKIFLEIAEERKIKVFCVLQPYYSFGRSNYELNNQNFFNINKTIDQYMKKAYHLLDNELKSIKNINYYPIYKELTLNNLSIFTDALHLNNQGYELVSEKLFKLISDKL